MSSILEKRVLILDRNWNATNVVDATVAISKMYTGDAYAMDDSTYALYNWAEWVDATHNHTEDMIRTSSTQFKVPNVIVLNKSVKKCMNRMASLTRIGVLLRDRHRCAYCQCSLTENTWTWDHIVPRSKGGESVWTNLVAACQPCNVIKSNKPIHATGMKLRTAPYHPSTMQMEAMMLAHHLKRDVPHIWKILLRDVKA